MRTDTPRAYESRRGGVLKKLMVAIAIVFLILIVLVASEVFAALTAKGAITTDYGQRIHDRTLERQRAVIGEGPNQWPRFAEILAKVEQGQIDLERRNAAYQPAANDPFPAIDFWIIRGPYDDPSAYNTPNLATHYARARRRGIEALDHWRDIGVFEASADLPSLHRVSMPPAGAPAVESRSAEPGRARALARAMAARVRLAAESGDPAEQLAVFEEGLALARIMADSGSILGWLTAHGIDGLVVECFLDDAFLYPIDDATLAGADAAIGRELVDHYPGIADIMMDQRDAAHDHIQHVYDSDGRFIPRNHARLSYTYDIDDAPDELLPVGDSDWSNVHARVFVGRKAADAWIDDAYDLADACAKATGPAALTADAALAAHYDAAGWRNPARDINVEPLQLIETARRRTIQVAGWRVVLAIERHRLAHDGAPPQRLSDLGDLLPDHLRTDPFTEQPWDYQPAPITTGWNNQPLTAHQIARPYSLSSRPMPGLAGVQPPFPSHPKHGVLITMPVERPMEWQAKTR